MTEESGKHITDKHGKERFVADKSLENLKLGPQSRNQGKVRRNFTLLPKTISWLERGGNASGRIDEMVGKILSGTLVNSQASNSKNVELQAALSKISELEAQLQEVNQRAADQDKKIIAAIALLKDALPLPANKGGAIKEKIKQALTILTMLK